jgi:hypothetical protein
LCFLLLTRYISSRYAMLMCILIVLFVPLTIQYFLKMEGFANKKTASIIVAIFFSYCAIDSYYSFGESKTYLQDSIDWIAENVDENAGLVTNNHAVAYFSGKVEEYDLTQRNLTEEQILLSNIGDVIAAELTFETRELLAQQAIINKIVLLAAFPDSENGRIALYQRVD